MVKQDQFQVGDRVLSRIWHCFGNQRQSCDLEAASRLLRASRTNVLPINTHQMTTMLARSSLQIGYSGVTFDALARDCDISEMHPMLNINLQTSASAAVERTLLAHKVSGISLIKIEVLRATDIDESDDSELVAAVAELRALRPELTIIPLCSADPLVASDLVKLGCPALRIMGSPIGSMAGITNPELFKRCSEIGVPIVLDGGVGVIDHVAEALRLGAQGCLVNSMLFSDPRGPVAAMEDFAHFFREEAARLTPLAAAFG